MRALSGLIPVGLSPQSTASSTPSDVNKTFNTVWLRSYQLDIKWKTKWNNFRNNWKNILLFLYDLYQEYSVED